MNNCSVCSQPITNIEIIIDANHRLCQDCASCSVCNKQVIIDDIRLCIANKRTIKHDSCARVPRRRCSYMDNLGQQCDTWFPAHDASKLCPQHKDILSNGNHINEEQTPRYIDLVNDERTYCYHFKDGTSQNQDKELIYQFKDDESGSVFQKLDNHIAFLEKVISDLKTIHQTARAVRLEALDKLTEEERKELRKIKIERATTLEKEKVPTIKKDPIGFLAKTKHMSASDAKSLLELDVDSLLAKYENAKKTK